MSVQKENSDMSEIVRHELTKKMLKILTIPKDLIIITAQYTLVWREEYMGKFGSQGNLDGMFKSPRGIAVSGNQIYVSDTWNHQIQIFDLMGKYRGKFGSQGNSDGMVEFPYGI